MQADLESQADPGPDAGAMPAAQRGRPVRNAAYLSAATLISKVFSLFLLIYMTKKLGTGLYGFFTIVTAFVGNFNILAELGMTSLAVRDIAQDRSLAVRYVSNLLALRGMCALIGIALVVVLAQAFVAPSLHGAVYVYSVTLVAMAVWNTMQLVFQFTERMSYNAVLNVAMGVTTALLSIIVLYMGHHVLGLVVVYTAVLILTAAAATWLVYTRFLPRRFELDFGWWPELVRRAFPFAMLVLLNVLYSNVDMMILQVMKGCVNNGPNVGCPSTGLYGIASRLPNILLVIFVGSMNSAILPAFNRVVAESRDALWRSVRSATRLMLVFGVPVALLGTFFSREAILVLGDRDFLAAAPALSILMWTFPCYLVVSLFYSALYAVHRQNVVVSAFAVTLVFNVSLNILLIPRYSYFASAALTVASEVVNGVIVYAALRQSLGPLRIGDTVWKIGVVALVTAAALWALHPFGIFVGLPVGALMLLLGLRLMRVLGPSEREILGRVPLLGRYAGLL